MFLYFLTSNDLDQILRKDLSFNKLATGYTVMQEISIAVVTGACHCQGEYD